MESSYKTQLKVGVFVALGLLVLAGSILLLGGDQSFFKSTYRLKTHLADVQGLGPGSVVSLSGLPIGNVHDISFAGENDMVQVSMNVDENFQHRITTNSIASIKTQGALGDKYIYILPGEKGGKVLKDGDMLASDNSAGFIDIIAEKGEDFAALGDVIREVHTLLKALNYEGRSQIIFNNLQSSSHDLKEILGNTKLLLRDLRGTSEKDNKLRQSLTHLSSILEKVDKGDGTLGALINNKALHDRILGIMGDSPRNQYLKPLIRDSIRTQEGQ